MFAVGMAEGYSEGDLRSAAAAQARTEISKYINLKLEAALKRHVAEQQNLVNHNEDVSQIVFKETTEQSTSMVLSLSTIENYYTEKLEAGRLKVYARVRIDLPKIKLDLKNLMNGLVTAKESQGKKMYIENKAEEGLAKLAEAIDSSFNDK